MLPIIKKSNCFIEKQKKNWRKNFAQAEIKYSVSQLISDMMAVQMNDG